MSYRQLSAVEGHHSSRQLCCRDMDTALFLGNCGVDPGRAFHGSPLGTADRRSWLHLEDPILGRLLLFSDWGWGCSSALSLAGEVSTMSPRRGLGWGLPAGSFVLLPAWPMPSGDLGGSACLSRLAPWMMVPFSSSSSSLSKSANKVESENQQAY